MPEVKATCQKCGKEFSYCTMKETKKRRSLCDCCKEKKQKYGKDFLVVNEEVKKKKGFLGLWHGRTGWYRSTAFKKKDIETMLLGEKDCKCIIMRHNKFKKSGDNKPDFVFAFADASDAQKITEELPYQTAKEIDNGTTYITVEEAIRYARENAYMIRDGYDIYDAYCECDLEGKTLSEIIDEQMEESLED